MSTEPSTTNWIPSSSNDRAMVAEQLERILLSPLFKHSKRYSPFLRYVVEKSLAGQRDFLKERTIGVEVFGRDPLYDTNNDPIVRVTSGEVRRRIAQYYHENGHEQELRIELSPGSYVPEFFPVATPRQAEELAVIDGEIELPSIRQPRIKKKIVIPLAGLLSILVLLALAAEWRAQSHAALDKWWQPAFHSPSPVLLAVGIIGNPVPAQPPSSPELQSAGEDTRRSDRVGLVDAIALERFASLLSMHGQSYRTLSSATTTYNDLRGGPVVLVAGLNNPWTLHITDPLRFHFAVVPEAKLAMIADRQHPENTGWHIDFSLPHSQIKQDYAIVARLHDATSEKPIFIAAGIGGSGTSAAAEFLTAESSLRELVSKLPAHWEDRNVEAVIQTKVIGGEAGPPQLVSVHVW
ncbi:MAG TPA: hypothetical protein VM554_02250 [Acidisarcina sp.]|nr:hypothetical protein [Acidisarcina sp.]